MHLHLKEISLPGKLDYDFSSTKQGGAWFNTIYFGSCKGEFYRLKSN